MLNKQMNTRKMHIQHAKAWLLGTSGVACSGSSLREVMKMKKWQKRVAKKQSDWKKKKKTGYNRLWEQVGLRNSINLKCMIMHLTKHLTMPPLSKCCQFCWKTFATQRGVSQHISASIICLKEWHKSIIRKNDSSSPKQKCINSPEPSLVDDLPNNPDPTHHFDDADNQANVEDTDNSHDNDLWTPEPYVEPFLGPAGDVLRQEKTSFEILQGVQQSEGKPPWELFASRAEWELAEWLMKNVGQRSTNDFLQLPIVSCFLCLVLKKLIVFKGKQSWELIVP